MNTTLRDAIRYTAKYNYTTKEVNFDGTIMLTARITMSKEQHDALGKQAAVEYVQQECEKLILQQLKHLTGELISDDKSTTTKKG